MKANLEDFSSNICRVPWVRQGKSEVIKISTGSYPRFKELGPSVVQCKIKRNKINNLLQDIEQIEQRGDKYQRTKGRSMSSG